MPFRFTSKPIHISGSVRLSGSSPVSASIHAIATRKYIISSALRPRAPLPKCQINSPESAAASNSTNG